MRPILFHVGHMTIYSYGVLVAAGVLLGLFFAERSARPVGIDPDRVWNMGVYMVLAGLAGSKLWLLTLYAGDYWVHPRALLSFTTLRSGGVYYGGLGAAVLTGVLYAHFQKLQPALLADVFLTALPLGHAVGRLGCFAAGCCWGKPTSLPWGVTFTSPVTAVLVGTPLGVPLHPTQLYEAGLEFLDFIFLVWLLPRRSFPGQAAAAFLVLYGLERGAIEFVRGDPDRSLFFHDNFSLMQVVSLFLILIGAWIWWHGRKQAMTAPATFAPAPAVKR
jgi:phosphatidylglycerol:prolipoprotein diacylglycerol transferase